MLISVSIKLLLFALLPCLSLYNCTTSNEKKFCPKFSMIKRPLNAKVSALGCVVLTRIKLNSQKLFFLYAADKMMVVRIQL